MLKRLMFWKRPPPPEASQGSTPMTRAERKESETRLLIRAIKNGGLGPRK